jgi:hypothetical protein
MPARYRLPADDPWFASTWEGARLASLIDAANWPMAKKLAWIEEITACADQMEKAGRRRDAVSVADREAPQRRSK